MAERIATLAKAPFVSCLPCESLSPNAFGIAEARDVIFAPPCNHWARALPGAARRARGPHGVVAGGVARLAACRRLVVALVA